MTINKQSFLKEISARQNINRFNPIRKLINKFNNYKK